MRSAFPNVRLPIPEVGQEVRLRKWTAEEREHYFAEVANTACASAWIFAHSVADECGARAFGDEDIPRIGRLSAVLVQRVVKEALDRNCLYSDIDAREKELADNYERRFWFLLAGHLKKTVGELQAALSFDEFKDWLAYSRRHPIGDDLADIHTAMICQYVLATIPRKRGKKLPKVSDLIVDWWKPRQMSEQQIQDTFNSYFNTLKGMCEQTRERTGER